VLLAYRVSTCENSGKTNTIRTTKNSIAEMKSDEHMKRAEWNR